LALLTPTVRVELEWLGDEDLRVKFGSRAFDDLTIMKSRVPPEERGGEARELLAASAVECMATMLLYLLKKVRVDLQGLRAAAEVTAGKDEEGNLCVEAVDVAIRVGIPGDDEARSRFERVRTILQKGCLISRSLERGVHVRYDISTL